MNDFRIVQAMPSWHSHPYILQEQITAPPTVARGHVYRGPQVPNKFWVDNDDVSLWYTPDGAVLRFNWVKFSWRYQFDSIESAEDYAQDLIRRRSAVTIKPVDDTVGKVMKIIPANKQNTGR